MSHIFRRPSSYRTELQKSDEIFISCLRGKDYQTDPRGTLHQTHSSSGRTSARKIKFNSFIHEYITFRSSDIKEFQDIRVCESPSATPGGPIGGKAHGYGDFNKAQINEECQKQIINHLDNLFTEKNLANVEITCEGEDFNCHQSILSARSSGLLGTVSSRHEREALKESPHP